MQEHRSITELLSRYYDSRLKKLTDSAVAVSNDFNEAVMKLQTALRPKMKHMIAIGNIDF